MGYLKSEKPPCTKDCPYRRPLVDKYGTCHSERCPLGWDDYTARQNVIYEERITAANNRVSTAGKIKMARKVLRDRKRERR